MNTPAAPSRNGTFRIAVRKFGAFESAIQAQWADFEAQAHTGLKLKAVPMELTELEHALLHAPDNMASGAWDVAFVATDWIAAMHAGGHARDLRPLLETDPPDGYPEAWSDSLLRLQRLGDSVLGLPYHDGPECLMFRKDLFDDPGEQRRFYRRFHRPLAPPSTWTEFRHLAQFFQRPSQGLYGTAFAAFPDGHNSVYDFLLQLWTHGGELFDAAGNARFDTPEAAQALRCYRELVTDGSATHPHSREFDSVAAGMRFAAGEVALMVNWFGFAVHAHTAADSRIAGLVDIAPVPAARAGRSVSLNVYWILALASGSPHRDIAWQFLRHVASPAMDKLTTAHGAIGCRQSTWTDREVNAAIPFYSRMRELHESAREIPQRADWPHLARVIDAMVSGAVGSSAPIEMLLRHAQTDAAALAR